MTAVVKSAGRRTAFIEAIAFVAIALISKSLLDPFIWRFSGPITLIGTLIVLTFYMRMRGYHWSEFGLRSLPGVKAKLLILPQALLTMIAVIGSSVLVIEGGKALGLTFMADPAEGVNKRWGDLHGNLPLYLLWMGIVWTSAAFGEEMFFRGFLVSRLKTAFSGVQYSSALAVLLPALLFGVGHMYYQGLRGLIAISVIGAVFGVLFLLYKRNLWPLILAHGLIDSLVFTGLFMGWDF